MLSIVSVNQETGPSAVMGKRRELLRREKREERASLRDGVLVSVLQEADIKREYNDFISRMMCVKNGEGSRRGWESCQTVKERGKEG